MSRACEKTSGGEFASSGASARAQDATLRISGVGATLSERSCCRPQYLQPPPPSLPRDPAADNDGERSQQRERRTRCVNRAALSRSSGSDAKDHQVGPDPLLGEGYQDRFLDHQRRRQRVGQPTRQHPSGCPVDDRDQSPGSAAKSKYMRDRNLGMSGSRETRVAPGSIGVRSRLPAGGRWIRTLGRPPPGGPAVNPRAAGEPSLRGVPARVSGRAIVDIRPRLPSGE
jgi:hypothetical protein